jgi:hypothetical protein
MVFNMIAFWTDAVSHLHHEIKARFYTFTSIKKVKKFFFFIFRLNRL